MTQEKPQEETTERTQADRKGLVEELNAYGHHTSVKAINRDGDFFFTECPECKNTDLGSMRLLTCGNCMTVFMPYYEDGFKSFSVITEGSSVTPSCDHNSIVLFRETKDDYFWYVILGRNEGRKKELMEKYPNGEFKTLGRDYRDGKDCHGHAPYKRYALIPLKD